VILNFCSRPREFAPARAAAPGRPEKQSRGGPCQRRRCFGRHVFEAGLAAAAGPSGEVRPGPFGTPILWNTALGGPHRGNPPPLARSFKGAPRRLIATGFLYDESLDEPQNLGRLARARFAEADTLPPLLGALLLGAKLATTEPVQRQAWLAPLLAGLYLRRRGRTEAHLLSFHPWPPPPAAKNRTGSEPPPRPSAGIWQSSTPAGAGESRAARPLNAGRKRFWRGRAGDAGKPRPAHASPRCSSTPPSSACRDDRRNLKISPQRTDSAPRLGAQTCARYRDASATAPDHRIRQAAADPGPGGSGLIVRWNQTNRLRSYAAWLVWQPPRPPCMGPQVPPKKPNRSSGPKS